MEASDRAQVAEWKRTLWDEDDGTDDDETVFVWESETGVLGGFVSVSLRPWAEGCVGAPVPYVEGWYVTENLRRQGIGRALIQKAEAWAQERGFAELGSDVRLDNPISFEAHERLGFVPTEQLQFFRKSLRPAESGTSVRVEDHTGSTAELTPSPMFALVLTGPPGAGKTAVLEALTDALSAEDVRHATVEVEALTSVHPPLSDEQWPAPAEAICELYRRFGYELLLVTVTVESDAHLRSALAAIGADEHVVVRLHAEPATLRQRIIDREPDTFTELDELVAAAARLSPVIASLDGIALALSTEGERPAAVAERIRDAWPAKLRPD
jgi:GNAT superfamily N-acetyltransferase